MVTDTRQSWLAVRPSVCVPVPQAVHCVDLARGELVSGGHALHGGLPVLE